MPETKAVVTMRLDRDVLEWFKGPGRGYQTRIFARPRRPGVRHPGSEYLAMLESEGTAHTTAALGLNT